MPTYKSAGNFDALRTPLYQPNFPLLDRVVEQEQNNYERGVGAIRNEYNEMLGLSQNLSEYNQGRLNSMMEEASNKLRKVATLDFSKQENVGTALNIFSPITQDQDIMMDNSLQKHGSDEIQKALSMRDSKDKDQREGYSDYNLQYITNPLGKLRGAKTRDELYAAAKDMQGRYYLPYQNTTAKLEKMAKDAGLDFSIDKVNNQYIVTNKFGHDAYGDLMNFARSHMDANDIKQLDINSTVAMENLQAQGLVTNEQLAGHLWEGARAQVEDELSNRKQIKGGLEQRVKEMEDRYNASGWTDESKAEVLENKSIIKAYEDQIEELEKQKNEFDNKTGNAAKLYQDYLKNPKDKAMDIAYNQLVSGWADQYAQLHHVETWKMNDVWANLLNDTRQRDLDKDKTKAEKIVKPTEAELKRISANTPYFAGIDPYRDQLVKSYTKALIDAGDITQKQIDNDKDEIGKYYASVLNLNWDLVHTQLQTAKASGKKTPSPELVAELKKTPMFADNADKLSIQEISNSLTENGMRNIQENIDAAGNASALPTNLADLVNIKNRLDQNVKTLETIKTIENDPNKPINALMKDKDQFYKEGAFVSEQEYVDQRRAKAGYTKKQALYDTGERGGSQALRTVYEKDGKQYTEYDMNDKFAQEYKQKKAFYEQQEKLAKQDPDIQKIIFSQAFGLVGYDARKDVDDEMAETLMKNVFTPQTLSGGNVNVSNLEDIMKDSGFDYSSATDRETVMGQLSKLSSLKKGDYSVYTTGYQDNQGRNPYIFRFDNKDLLEMKNAFSTKEGEPLSKLISNVQSKGVVIAYNGPSAADVIRENTVAKYLDTNKNYDFKLDSGGNFSISLKKVPNFGSDKITGTVTYMGYRKNADGTPVKIDGKPIFEKTSISADDRPDNMSIDEYYNVLLAQLVQSMREYKQNVDMTK